MFTNGAVLVTTVPPGLEPGQVAQSLHGFEADNEIGAALRYEVGSYRVGRQTEVRLHVAASLAHAVYFGLLHIKVFFEGRAAQNGGDREDTLSAHAG